MHLGQRRLAGSVVADQPEALARIEVEVDAAQRLDRPEGLEDAAQARRAGIRETGFGCLAAPGAVRHSFEHRRGKARRSSLVTMVIGTAMFLLDGAAR